MSPPAASGALGLAMSLTHLLLKHRDVAAVRRRLAAIEHPTATRLLALLEARADAIGDIVEIANSPLDRAGGGAVEGEIARCRDLFDWAVRRSPEASVAFYSLGDPALLDAATQEVVALMRDFALLSPDRVMLDLGCGIGRFAVALAPWLASITAIDLSPAMLEEAGRRCQGLANVSFALASGRDLAAHEDASFDLVLAADSLPYVFRAGGEPLLLALLREAARVLRVGGQLLALNLTYRGDIEADRRWLRRAAPALGLAILTDGTAPLTSWDGSVFRLRKQV